MISEWRGIEYVLEVLRALHHNSSSRYDSKSLAELVKVGGRIEVNVSYLQKVLQRMSRINLINANNDGYALTRPLNEIMVSDVLNYCTHIDDTSPAQQLIINLKLAVSLTGIDEFYDFA